MRPYAKGALLVLLFCLGARASFAQEPEQQQQQKDRQGSSNHAYRAIRETPDLPRKPIKARPLTASEGLAILGEALDFRHHANLPEDCSHFVHELYGRAGFPYEYASSSDLYAGIDEFRRVPSPQPGDLAVWPGHAGIVVNPAQHSFFSALSSGHGVDSYDSPYWKQRGQPRFYRYVKPIPGGVLSTSIRAASLKPAALGQTEPREASPDDSASDRSVLDRSLPDQSQADRSQADRSEESWNEVGSSTKLAENLPMHATTPPVPVVYTLRPKPDQVSAAFLESCKGWGESLRERDLFKSAQPVIVFDHFEVRKVHLAGNQGWAEVQIDELLSVTDGKAQVHQRSERQRWLLRRRNKTSWELASTRDTIYLPQPIAVRILAHELAQLTDDTPNTVSRPQEKAELARLLDGLLGK
jgi:hypothetical protein